MLYNLNAQKKEVTAFLRSQGYTCHYAGSIRTLFVKSNVIFSRHRIEPDILVAQEFGYIPEFSIKTNNE